GPPNCSGGPLLRTMIRLAAWLLTRRDCDLHRFTALSREAREHRVDEARDHDVQPVRLRPGLRTAVKQRRVGAGLTDVKVDLAVMFDVAVDSATATDRERIVPAHRVPAPAAPSEAPVIGSRT